MRSIQAPGEIDFPRQTQETLSQRDVSRGEKLGHRGQLITANAHLNKKRDLRNFPQELNCATARNLLSSGEVATVFPAVHHSLKLAPERSVSQPRINMQDPTFQNTREGVFPRIAAEWHDLRKHHVYSIVEPVTRRKPFRTECSNKTELVSVITHGIFNDYGVNQSRHEMNEKRK